MTLNLQIQENQLLDAGFQEQTLSLLLPFEPKVNSRSQIESRIRYLTDQAERQLLERLPRLQVKLILAQLQSVVENLNFHTYKRSIVIKATPLEGKVYYWNIPVEEAVIISREFPVRQLLAKRKVEKEYLLLAMGDHFAGIYLGNGTRLSKLVANSPAPAPHSDDPSDDGHNVNALQRSIRHLDDALTILLRSYRYPVFIIAPSENLANYRQVSRNLDQIVAFVEAAPDGHEKHLQQLMLPYLTNWQDSKERILVQSLERALQNGKLAVGISEVWKAAAEKRGRLLVVEEDYIFPAYLDQKDGILYADAIPISQTARQVDDAVSDTIEKVLGDGSIVEVVRKGVLSDFVHTAMICY
jgi:hypothetical protein